MTLGACPQCRSRGLLAQDRAVLLCRPRRERRGLRVCGQTRGVRRFGTSRRPYQRSARPWQHLAHEWAHSPMIRPKLVTQIRASQPPDQDEYARRSRKRHLPVQVRSGAGRIGRLQMRPMSLYESGHSSGAISLQHILDGGEPTGRPADLSIPDLLERIVIGGWPDLLDAAEQHARVWLGDYLQNLAEVDLPGLGPRRNPAKVERLLAGLGRSAAAPLNRSALAADVGGSAGPIATETLNNYLDALDRLMLIEPLPAWRPHMRSRTRLRASPVNHFVDPS